MPTMTNHLPEDKMKTYDVEEWEDLDIDEWEKTKAIMERNATTELLTRDFNPKAPINIYRGYRDRLLYSFGLRSAYNRKHWFLFFKDRLFSKWKN